MTRQLSPRAFANLGDYASFKSAIPETGLMVAFVAAHTAFLDRGIWSLLILDFGS